MASNSVLAKLAVNISANTADFNRGIATTQKGLSNFQRSVKDVAKLAGGLFLADRLLDFGGAILDVTVKFQKFEAVLTNTLGSNSAAKMAMDRIQHFAASTPFQVDELTSSFVKLANQGFLPTTRELTSLGDLASAMGKSFDQLTEAIIDAQTGEFERLKEFGIRASKQGDQITFTFKGVKTQVDFTADSIRKYILSLGDAEGVSGGMAKQSETLGGKISNLKDSFDQLLLSIGQLLTKGGFVNSTLEAIARTLQMAAGTFTGDEKAQIEAVINKMKELQGEVKRGSERWVMLNDEILRAEGALRRVIQREKDLAKVQADAAAAASKAAAAEQARLAAIEAAALQRLRTGAGGLQSGVSGKTGADFLFDSGALASMANAGANALRGLTGELSINSNAWAEWLAGVQASTQIAQENFAMDLGPAISGVLTDMASALGRAAAGAEDFGKAILQSIGGFMQQFGGALIALGIGKLALEKFSGPAMIAAGVVLAAAGSALQASTSSSARNIGSGGSSSVSSRFGTGAERFRANSSVQDSSPQLQTVIRGEDLWIVLQNYQANNRLTRG